MSSVGRFCFLRAKAFLPRSRPRWVVECEERCVLLLAWHVRKVRDNYIADVIARIEGLNDDGKGAKHAGASCCAKHAMPIASDMQDTGSG